MFLKCNKLLNEYLNLIITPNPKNWKTYLNVSKVKNMYAMFAYCPEFNQILRNWKLNEELYLKFIFYKCTKLIEKYPKLNNNNPDIKQWDTYWTN